MPLPEFLEQYFEKDGTRTLQELERDLSFSDIQTILRDTGPLEMAISEDQYGVVTFEYRGRRPADMDEELDPLYEGDGPVASNYVTRNPKTGFYGSLMTRSNIDDIESLRKYV